MKMMCCSQLGIIVLCAWVSGQSVAEQLPPNSQIPLDTVKIEQLAGIKAKLDAI